VPVQETLPPWAVPVTAQVVVSLGLGAGEGVGVAGGVAVGLELGVAVGVGVAMDDCTGAAVGLTEGVAPHAARPPPSTTRRTSRFISGIVTDDRRLERRRCRLDVLPCDAHDACQVCRGTRREGGSRRVPTRSVVVASASHRVSCHSHELEDDPDEDQDDADGPEDWDTCNKADYQQHDAEKDHLSTPQ